MSESICAEYRNGEWWLNLRRRGFVRLEELLDQADTDRRLTMWAIALAIRELDATRAQVQAFKGGCWCGASHELLSPRERVGWTAG